MCGIVGILGSQPVAPLMLDALRRLEYRGYDSAGIATLEDGELVRQRAPGKLNNLKGVLARRSLGNPWCADREQRTSPYRKRRCGCAQRHY